MMSEFLLNEYKDNVLTFLFQINGMKGGKFGMNTVVWGLLFVVCGLWFFFGVWGLGFGVEFPYRFKIHQLIMHPTFKPLNIKPAKRLNPNLFHAKS